MVDLVLLQEVGDALDIAFDARILEGEHGSKIEDGLHPDAHGGEAVFRFGVALARVEQRL